MRKIRTHLLQMHKEAGSPEGLQGTLPFPAKLKPTRPVPESLASSPFPADVDAPSPGDLSTHFSDRHQAAEELSSRTGRKTKRSGPAALTSSKEKPGQIVRRLPAVSSGSAPHPSAPKKGQRLTLERAIQEYLQAHRNVGHRPKTLEWHQMVLYHLQQYLQTECSLHLVHQITETTIRSWLASLAQTPTPGGSLRSASTIETYARSTRAFFGWLVERGVLSCSPLSESAFPQSSPHMVSPATFEQVMRDGFSQKAQACGAKRLIARDRALQSGSTCAGIISCSTSRREPETPEFSS